jgi:hypothetical protein
MKDEWGFSPCGKRFIPTESISLHAFSKKPFIPLEMKGFFADLLGSTELIDPAASV